MNDFIENTIDHNLFQVEDVESDNACFYRSIANGLGFISNEKLNLKDIVSKKKFGYRLSFQDFYQSHNWGFNGDKQDSFARDLQQLSLDWISKKSDENIPLENQDLELGITMEELIMMVHGLTYQEYVEIYRYYAGDVVLGDFLEDSGNILENNIDETGCLVNRWGGYTEQVALSEQLQIPIIVLSCQKYNEHLEKIINGRINNNKPIKGVRFKIYQTSGLKYFKRDGPVIYLLWKKTKDGEHYMSLYPKNPKCCIDAVNEILNN